MSNRGSRIENRMLERGSRGSVTDAVQAPRSGMTGIPIALQILISLVVQIALPGYLVYGVWRARDLTRGSWLLRTGASGAYIGFVFIAGRWDFVGYPLRFVWPVLFGLATWAGATRARRLSWSGPRPRWKTIGDLAGLAALVGALVAALRGWAYSELPVALELPLRGGVFYVGHGGDSALLNHHHPVRPQRYALDIVQLRGAVGTRAEQLFSSDLSRYFIFGAPVYSPCDGRVAGAVDGLPDQPPPRGDATHPPGNHVVIACRGVRVVLAHLQQNSVVVTAHSHVATGDMLGLVGNSGNSTEPHLHVHATRADGDRDTGLGVPMTFGERFATRNSVFRN
jgi:hypothetical protein